MQDEVDIFLLTKMPVHPGGLRSRIIISLVLVLLHMLIISGEFLFVLMYSGPLPYPTPLVPASLHGTVTPGATASYGHCQPSTAWLPAMLAIPGSAALAAAPCPSDAAGTGWFTLLHPPRPARRCTLQNAYAVLGYS